MRVTGLHDLPQKKISRLNEFFVTHIYRKKKLPELKHTRLGGIFLHDTAPRQSLCSCALCTSPDPAAVAPLNPSFCPWFVPSCDYDGHGFVPRILPSLAVGWLANGGLPLNSFSCLLKCCCCTVHPPFLNPHTQFTKHPLTSPSACPCVCLPACPPLACAFFGPSFSRLVVFSDAAALHSLSAMAAPEKPWSDVTLWKQNPSQLPHKRNLATAPESMCSHAAKPCICKCHLHARGFQSAAWCNVPRAQAAWCEVHGAQCAVCTWHHSVCSAKTAVSAAGETVQRNDYAGCTWYNVQSARKIKCMVDRVQCWVCWAYSAAGSGHLHSISFAKCMLQYVVHSVHLPECAVCRT